jgi:hypothetical protein
MAVRPSPRRREGEGEGVEGNVDDGGAKMFAIWMTALRKSASGAFDLMTPASRRMDVSGARPLDGVDRECFRSWFISCSIIASSPPTSMVMRETAGGRPWCPTARLSMSRPCGRRDGDIDREDAAALSTSNERVCRSQIFHSVFLL